MEYLQLLMILGSSLIQVLDAQDSCSVNCLWGADGILAGTTCAWLLDPSSEVYASRRWYCSNDFAPDCGSTCQTVLNELDDSTNAPVSTKAPAAIDSCKDGVFGIHIAGGSYSCKYLTQQLPEDRFVGIYRARESICNQTITDCCASCKIVAKETACQDEALGVQVAGGRYACKYLTKQYSEDRLIGIYASRERICKSPLTQCCESCKVVAKETACRDERMGIKLADGSYSCKYLVRYYPEDRLIGIYNDRKAICASSLTKCCASCKIVADEICEDEQNGIQIAGGSYSCKYLTHFYPEDAVLGIYSSRIQMCENPLTKCCASCRNITNEAQTTAAEQTTMVPTTAVKTTVAPVTPKPVEDKCEVNCLWIADSALPGSKCSWLLDPSSQVYSTRKVICNNGQASGCRKTCSVVLSNSDEPSGPQTSAPVCQDTYIVYNKLFTYQCSELRRAESDIYNERFTLCNRYSTECCQTCRLVASDKESGEIKYGQNDVSNDGNVVIVNLPADDTASAADEKSTEAPLNPFISIMQRQMAQILERQSQEQKKINRMLDMFTAFFQRFRNMRL